MRIKKSLRIRTYWYCLLALLLVPQAGGVIEFTLEPANPSYAKNGSSAKLVWDYSVDDKQAELQGILYSVLVSGGYFTNMLVQQNDGTVVNHPDIPDAYKGRVKIEGRASLAIENVTLQDNTAFQCQLVAKPGVGQDVVSIVQLLVTVAPKISLSSVQPSYNEGFPVNISCTTSGTPDPDVQWIRNGIPNSSGRKTAFLTFSSMNRAHHGQYSCRANNSVGNEESHLTLVVHYKPEGTTLTTSAADNTVTQGGSVTFTCHVTAAKPPVSRYRFYLNDTTPVKDGNDSQYTINNVQRSQHYGKYKCVPRNDVGDGPEATVTLNVNIPVQFTVLPQNVTVNETNPIVLSCDASGFPEPFFTWTKDGQVLSQPKQLSIQRSHRNNTGIYMCTASNGVGQDKTTKGFVKVQYPPTIKEATTSTDMSWIGQTVTLKCVSDGVPTPTLTWYKPDGRQIKSITATQNTVNVKMNGDQHFGGYKCDADSGFTPADFKIVKIEQIKKPGSPTIAQSVDIQATSLTVKWTAPAGDGGSPITAYRVVILRGSTEIKNVNITDPDTTSWTAGGLERDTEYTVKVLARNAVFERPAVEKAVKTKYEGVTKFTLQPANPSYAKNGSTAKLVWDYSVDDKQKELLGIFFSVKVGGTITRLLLQQNDGTVLKNPNIPSAYKGRVRIEGNATLVIENVSPQDNAVFSCELSLWSPQPDMISSVPLLVTVAPQISLSSVPSSYNEGSSVNISCAASGTPDPDVQWIRNGIVKSSGKKTAFLTFNSINRADDGQYTCRANNAAGDDENHVTLVVHYPPTIKEATLSSDKSWIGQTVTLKCESDGVPTPTLTWYKPDGRQINRITATQNTMKVKMSVDQDFGGYKCDAGNGLTPADFKIVKIEQIKKPGSPTIAQLGIQATSLTVKWTAPADVGGSSITAYQVVLLKGGTQVTSVNITDPRRTSWTAGGLERDTKYTVKVLARNAVFEGPAVEKTVKTKYGSNKM